MTVRRVWLFARGGGSALLLRYSCPEEHYGDFRRPFGESIRSFTPADAGEGEPTSFTPPEKPPEKPPPRHVDPAAELLRLLRRKQERETSKKAVDEVRNQKPDGKR